MPPERVFPGGRGAPGAWTPNVTRVRQAAAAAAYAPTTGPARVGHGPQGPRIILSPHVEGGGWGGNTAQRASASGAFWDGGGSDACLCDALATQCHECPATLQHERVGGAGPARGLSPGGCGVGHPDGGCPYQPHLTVLSVPHRFVAALPPTPPSPPTAHVHHTLCLLALLIAPLCLIRCSPHPPLCSFIVRALPPPLLCVFPPLRPCHLQQFCASFFISSHPLTPRVRDPLLPPRIVSRTSCHRLVSHVPRAHHRGGGAHPPGGANGGSRCHAAHRGALNAPHRFPFDAGGALRRHASWDSPRTRADGAAPGCADRERGWGRRCGRRCRASNGRTAPCGGGAAAQCFGQQRAGEGQRPCQGGRPWSRPWPRPWQPRRYARWTCLANTTDAEQYVELVGGGTVG